jgi:hypothetical protein
MVAIFTGIDFEAQKVNVLTRLFGLEVGSVPLTVFSGKDPAGQYKHKFWAFFENCSKIKSGRTLATEFWLGRSSWLADDCLPEVW